VRGEQDFLDANQQSTDGLSSTRIQRGVCTGARVLVDEREAHARTRSRVLQI
jgi:hypothetical protein